MTCYNRSAPRSVPCPGPCCFRSSCWWTSSHWGPHWGSHWGSSSGCRCAFRLSRPGISTARWKATRPATCWGPSSCKADDHQSRSRRRDVESRRRLRPARQDGDAIGQDEAALKLDPSSSAVRLNLALAYYKSARPQPAIAQLKQVIASDPQARNAYLVLADCYLQVGNDQEVIALLKPREALLGSDCVFLPARHGAAAHGRRRRRADLRRSRVRRRRVRRGALADGHRAPRQARLSGCEDGAPARRAASRLPTAQSLYGRALRLLGEQDAAERAFRKELELNANDFEANLQLGEPAEGRPEVRGGVGLPRTRDDRSSGRPHRAQAARHASPADRQGRRGRPVARIDRRGGA